MFKDGRMEIGNEHLNLRGFCVFELEANAS